ncbi:MAG: hypothetical protein KAG66_05060, partial [Methylococcales bacterium]|nr:hypothetical protein [Methylococcales bacterium]
SPGMDKSIFVTSQTITSGVNGPEQDITIGEEVTYRFTVTIPEGTSLAAEAIDQLPTGANEMEVVSSQVISIGAQLTVPGAGVGTAGTVNGANNEVTWALGDVVNAPGGGSGDADDQIVFEVVAVLMDVGANASGDDDVVNTASFTTGSTTIMDTALIDIVEPVVNVAKDTVPSGLTADAGDVLDYQITLTHDAASNSDAFNFAVTDVLPTPGTEWINDGTVTSTCGPVSVNSTAAPSIVFSFATLPLVSGSCTINYQVQVNAAVMPNLTYQNTATAQYTSTNTVGVQTRTYTPMANADFVTPDPTLIKVSAASSLGDTGDTVQNGLLPDLAIGETINFDMTVIVPEGVTTNAVLVDTLPAGLEIVSATINTAGGNISTTLANVTAVPGSNTATFDFGTVTNVADGGVSPADYINVTVVALVSDIGTNVDLATLSNSASFTFGAGGAANTLTDTADVEIVEPNLALAKTMGPMVDHVVP